jgi:hypothetical protein
VLPDDNDEATQKQILKSIRSGRSAGSEYLVKVIENLTRRLAFAKSRTTTQRGLVKISIMSPEFCPRNS